MLQKSNKEVKRASEDATTNIYIYIYLHPHISIYQTLTPIGSHQMTASERCQRLTKSKRHVCLYLYAQKYKTKIIVEQEIRPKN